VIIFLLYLTLSDSLCPLCLTIKLSVYLPFCLFVLPVCVCLAGISLSVVWSVWLFPYLSVCVSCACVSLKDAKLPDTSTCPHGDLDTVLTQRQLTPDRSLAQPWPKLTSGQVGCVGYLTVHESAVPLGKSQRRSGLHAESPGSLGRALARAVPGMQTGTHVHHYPAWWGGGCYTCSPADEARGMEGEFRLTGGIFMASTVRW